MKMPLSSDGEYVIVFPSGQMADTKNMIRHNFDGDFKALAHCKDLAEKQGAKFLYVCPPAKWMMIPGEGRYSLLHDRNEGNELLYGRFFTRLSDNRIPFINLKKEFWSREIE